MEIEKLIYEKDDDPNDLFEFCLKNNLYKDDDLENDFISRMKKFFNKDKDIPYLGVSATIAYMKEEPIGICMLEHRLGEDNNIFHMPAGILHMDNRERKDPWKKKLDFSFIHLGFMSFYVKESARNKGVAQELLFEMEKLQLNRLSMLNIPKNVNKTMENNYLTVTVREKAKEILKKSTVFSPMHGDTHDGCFKNDISSLSYQIFFNEKTEKRLADIAPELFEEENRKNKKLKNI